MAPTQTKTDREMEQRMQAVASDPLRVSALGKARAFKRSWLELAEALSEVFEAEAWAGWGYESFDEYCKKELHVTKATASKLLGSFRYLEHRAPKVIERARTEPEAHIPSMRAIDFVARAEKRGAADPKALREIRRAAFDEGAEAPTLTKRFKEVAFPMGADERKQKIRGQLITSGKRIASLIAEPDAPLPPKVAMRLEEAIGAMLAALEAHQTKNLPN